MTHKQRYNLYIAACTEDGGIYRFTLSGDGKLTPQGFTPMDRPMYLAKENQTLYCLLRAPFPDCKDSGLISCTVDQNGSLTAPGKIVSTCGEVACHLAVENGVIWCVNYISGSVIRMPDYVVTHRGSGPNPLRQEAPHTHFVGLTPDKKYLCVTDLGLDSITVYDKDLHPVSRATVPAGHGVRHLAFSEDGRYCFAANELQSTVSAFSYEDGVLRPIHTASCLPPEYTGASTAAAIRLHRGHIFVSNRGHDSVAELSFDGEKLSLLRTHLCFGKGPRDFAFAGDFMICTNEESNSVTVLHTGERITKKTDEVSLKAPLCVLTEEL